MTMPDAFERSALSLLIVLRRATTSRVPLVAAEARRSALRADDIVEALIDALPAASEDGETEQERSFLRLTRRVAAQGEETE